MNLEVHLLDALRMRYKTTIVDMECLARLKLDVSSEEFKDYSDEKKADRLKCIEIIEGSITENREKIKALELELKELRAAQKESLKSNSGDAQ